MRFYMYVDNFEMTFHVLIILMSALCLVESKQRTVNRKAMRNTNLDDIYKTENQLWESRQCSRTCCITSCFEHIDCRSFAYNSNTERCQIFNRDFRGQSVPTGVISEEILHYDLVNVDCGMQGPFSNAPAADCADVQSQGYTCSGVYTIVTGGVTKQVWCDLQTDGGRWTVIQSRQDGSVEFDVSWNEYKDGFGNASQEYWIGNDALYILTSSGTVQLLILMERWNGAWFHARYSSFRVNDESDKYRITVSGFSGTAGDSFLYNNGQRFSTIDQDNDAWSGAACNPTYNSGGWWYKECAHSVLNGQYHDSPILSRSSCHWKHISNQYESLKTVFMMIRKI